jgi:two-component system chemotaxis response regulator CheB
MTADDKVRVLVVDDSPIFTEAVRLVIEHDRSMAVVGVAENGKQAVEMTSQLRPSVIIMDIQMPVMGGIEAIEQIMACNPTPILVCTAQPDCSQLAFEALRRGALDLIPKPENWPGTSREQEQFRQQIKLLSRVAVVRHIAWHQKQRYPESSFRPPAPTTTFPQTEIVGIVASTGGPAALGQIIRSLPPGLTAGVLVVQHLPTGFASSLVSWLNSESRLRVEVARDAQAIRPGTVYIAGSGGHLTVNRQGRIAIDRGLPVKGHRPSGTVLLQSLAEVYGPRAIGIVLTGMGDDGAQGLLAIRKARGRTIAQDAGTSVVYGIPNAAQTLGAAEMILPLEQIAPILIQLVSAGFGKEGR